MRRLTRRLGITAAIAGGLIVASEAGALAQGASQTASAVGTPIPNPYMTPYANPFLNPAMTSGSMSRNDAMLYLWAAQQQPGGLLGGRPAAPSPRAATISGGAMRPGGNASSYFNRGPDAPAAGLGNRYSRTNRYFPNNGR